MGQGKFLNGASAMGFAPPANTSTQQAQTGIRSAGTPTPGSLIQASPGNFGTAVPVTPNSLSQGTVQSGQYRPAPGSDMMYGGAIPIGAIQNQSMIQPGAFTQGMDHAAAPGDLLNQGIDGTVTPFGYRQ